MASSEDFQSVYDLYKKQGISNGVSIVNRPFTVHRKNSLFFSCEKGVETALTFFTLIETCKNMGLNARDYIATTIRLLMDGNKNYEDLVPMSMAV